MSKINRILQSVQSNVQNEMSALNYSVPKIYPKEIEERPLKSFNRAEKKLLLKKRWYVHFSFKNPETGKMERMPNVTFKMNKDFKTFDKRFIHANKYRNLLQIRLENGFNPFGVEEEKQYATDDMIDFALMLKKEVIEPTTYTDYENRASHFKDFLKKNGLSILPITDIKKKHINQYLNERLKKNTPRSRNNDRTVLSALFTILEDNEYIDRNFVKNIKPIRTIATRNKSYSNDEVDMIFKYLEDNDKNDLLLFIKFVSFNFLRPIEVCRLKFKDINLKQKTLQVKAKNSPLKVKIIPEILLKELRVLEFRPDDYVFGEIGTTSEPEYRRSNYTRKYSRVKKLLGFDKDYTIYSFRHTFITRLYIALRKMYSRTEALDKLMLITGHSSMKALMSYLRTIDAERPEDYSEHLQ